MLRDFIAIDFETANQQPSSVCSVGVVMVRDGQIVERIVEIFFSDQDLDDVRYQIATIPFVAHNARFDESCLKAVFRVYQMDYPDYRFYDTLTASRRQFGRSLPNHQLHTVAAACGYNLENHHHALADAEACAAIALYIL